MQLLLGIRRREVREGRQVLWKGRNTLPIDYFPKKSNRPRKVDGFNVDFQASSVECPQHGFQVFQVLFLRPLGINNDVI